MIALNFIKKTKTNTIIGNQRKLVPIILLGLNSLLLCLYT